MNKPRIDVIPPEHQFQDAHARPTKPAYPPPPASRILIRLTWRRYDCKLLYCTTSSNALVATRRRLKDQPLDAAQRTCCWRLVCQGRPRFEPLASPAWAREFLRRSPSYARDARRHGCLTARPRLSVTGVVHHTARQRLAFIVEAPLNRSWTTGATARP
jgi:hypothetical protein